jgi:Protein of unknown function (DUF2695)
MVIHDSRLSKIESDIRGFVRASYPEMIVRVEYWPKDPSRIALFFIDERFKTLYRRQRYHYVLHLIPKDYYDSVLTDTVWFELTPEERPEMIEDDPDEELIASITPDVMGALQERGFFALLDEMFCPNGGAIQAQTCSGDFRHAKQVLQLCRFEESDWSDVFHVLMGQGAFCDCEILYNAAIESRLKTQHWQQRSHQERRSE